MKWYAVPVVLILISIVLFAMPGRYEGEILLPISPGHALSVLDSIALIPLLTGATWLEVGLWKRRKDLTKALSGQSDRAFVFVFLGGLGLGMLIASAFSSFFWWFLIGAVGFAAFVAWLIHLSS